MVSLNAYVERYRGSLPARLLLAGGLLVVLPWGNWERLNASDETSVLGGPERGPLDTLSAVLSVPAVVLGVLLIIGAFVQIVWTVRRRVAFAADQHGLYLGPGLLPPAGSRRLPWNEVSRVQLRRVQGVRSGAGAAATWNRLIVHGPSGRRRLAARLVDGWRLDPRKLSAAVARLAPDVRVDR
ncbi:hypothetical protein Acsp03_63890 [Actinomadura sp. NBRC 104412]|uniref:hypothetical protein n=1 Tax=Actinomadura sp. NBRC 104412 TaxID=3032203 RepID=UPI0024A3CBAE|nr:hypothetical protein [Actinomadura sp. NBRC 104412]GLZ08923.1 hypothetical protein Acsp03_63890 [Actinomadura sp. NBRC 104412]